MVRKHFETSSRSKINTGRLIKQGQRYYVRYMGEQDLSHSLALQSHVVEALKKIGKSHYIIPKSEEQIKKLLNKGHAVIGTFVKPPGLFKNDKLAAHMIVVYPSSKEEAGLADDKALPSEDISKISVVSNILVHQDYRGNRLMQQMLGEWLKIAQSDGKTHAVAETSADNQFSWSVFLDCGFVIYGCAHDPRDNTDNFFLQKPLDREFIYSADPTQRTMLRLFDKNGDIDKKAYNDIKLLLEDGYHALDFDRPTGYVLLAKCVGTRPVLDASKDAPAPANDGGPK